MEKDAYSENAISTYNNNLLSELSKVEILSVEDRQKLDRCMKDIVDSFYTAQTFRTKTEMVVSVLNDFRNPTPDAKFWQATRELDVMAKNLFLLNFGYKKKAIELKILEMRASEPIDYNNERAVLDRDLIRVDIERTKWELLEMQREAHHRIREIGEWSTIRDILKEEMSCSTTDPNDHQLLALALRYCWEYYSSVKSGNPMGVGEARNLFGLIRQAIDGLKEKGMYDAFVAALKSDSSLYEVIKESGYVG